MKTNNRVSDELAVGIEIGGTKLQVGIGTTGGKLLKPIVRRTVLREDGAQGILRDISSMVEEALISTDWTLDHVHKIGIGFGGPLDSAQGIVLKSFQIEGWENFPLKHWMEDRWKKPVVVQNDASTAALAEALHGNGCGFSRIFYMTIGSGIGGGWVVDGRVDNGQGLGSAEMGHTWVTDPRTGKAAELEQVCSGWGIGTRARAASEKKATLMLELAGSLDAIDAKIVYAAAERGDDIACRILNETCEMLGLAIGNVIALLHPERIIIGGGVSLMGPLFWDPLRREVTARSMPAFASTVELVRAGLGADVVVIGALCL
jgi:glucokinase